MKIVIKVIKFFLLDRKTMLLFIEAYLYLGLARALIGLPFRKVEPFLGAHSQESSLTLDVKNKKAIIDVGNAVCIMSRYTLWESKCLIKAIAASKMLWRRRIESTIYLGTARGKNAELIAHAWLRSGPFYITGAEEMSKFTVVGKFAMKISDE